MDRYLVLCAVIPVYGPSTAISAYEPSSGSMDRYLLLWPFVLFYKPLFWSMCHYSNLWTVIHPYVPSPISMDPQPALWTVDMVLCATRHMPPLQKPPHKKAPINNTLPTSALFIGA